MHLRGANPPDVPQAFIEERALKAGQTLPNRLGDAHGYEDAHSGATPGGSGTFCEKYTAYQIQGDARGVRADFLAAPGEFSRLR